jgi:translocation and assembly module TamB
LTAKGVASRVGTTTIAWNADNLRLFGLPDLRVTVDGSGTVALAESEVALAGTISVRDGRIEFANRRDERLGDDVEVLDRPRSSSPKRRGKAPLKLALDIDLGKRFHIVGAGLDTDLTGRARIATRDTGDLVGKGTIDAVHGIYFFLGQRLEIERGRLIFDGPIENPALDVRAVRKGLPVEPGVELTGTLRTPHVTLTSTPPMSDGDTLSWLVLGRGFDTASAGDAVLIQTAAASLLDNSQSIPIGRRVAQAMGLDDISVKSSGQSQGQALAVGKRLSDRVYLTFERALAATQAAVGLEYLLGRGFRIRATGGQDSNVGVFFTRSWD